MTQIDEQWYDIQYNGDIPYNRIVSISNTGKYKTFDGREFNSERNTRITIFGERRKLYNAIASIFLVTVRRPEQIFVDHITHYPTEYNINDVRNLRWCTISENNSFEEARFNKSGTRSSSWKGDSATPIVKYHRALREYRANPTEKNLATLDEARLVLNEYRRNKRQRIIAKNTSSPI